MKLKVWLHVAVTRSNEIVGVDAIREPAQAEYEKVWQGLHFKDWRHEFIPVEVDVPMPEGTTQEANA